MNKNNVIIRLNKVIILNKKFQDIAQLHSYSGQIRSVV